MNTVSGLPLVSKKTDYQKSIMQLKYLLFIELRNKMYINLDLRNKFLIRIRYTKFE